MDKSLKGFIEKNEDNLNSIFKFKVDESGLGLCMELKFPPIFGTEFYKRKFIPEVFVCLIDYGVPFPIIGYHIDSFTEPLVIYARLSNSRVASSRKTLTALIICCKQRTHQGTLVFGAVRDVFFAVAREMWAQKGLADKCCGPRSKEWPT